MNYMGNLKFTLLMSLCCWTKADVDPQIPKTKTESKPKAEPFIFGPSESIFEIAAKSVAQLVSDGFSPSPPMSPSSDDSLKSEEGSSTGFMGNVLRLLGFDSTKLRAIAVNAVIFMAQLIGSALRGQAGGHLKQAFDLPPPGNPFAWIFQNSPLQVRHLVSSAQQRSLPDEMIDSLRDEAIQETDCVQLVVCKAAPLVWSMQKSLYNKPDESLSTTWLRLTPLERLFRHFPSMSELASQSQVCDNRFPSCKKRFSGVL